jgi:hypothetical protein
MISAKQIAAVSATGVVGAVAAISAGSSNHAIAYGLLGLVATFLVGIMSEDERPEG